MGDFHVESGCQGFIAMGNVGALVSGVFGSGCKVVVSLAVRGKSVHGE